MTEHESEVSPKGSAADAGATTPFSTNGSDPHHVDAESADVSNESGDGATFLADLARAMQSTAAAEQARNAEGTEQRRQAHVDAIRAREALEAEDLRELAKEDVKGIDAWSDGEMKRIKLERERRIAARREQLQVRLEEHRSVVGREVDAVEAAVGKYRTEIELYFERLNAETDPVAIARVAGDRPPFPVLELIGPDDAPAISAYQASPTSAPVATEPSDAISTDDDAAVADATSADETPAVASADAAEPMETEAAAETAVADEAADAGGTADAGEPARESESPLIGVMGDDDALQSGGKSRSAPAEAVAQPEAEAPAEADHVPGWPTEVAQASDASESPAETVATHEDTDSGTQSDETQEPVAAVAEAMVVMPRSSGAGSWLRWPNSSVDHNDSTR
jgi:hypothetical protein